MLVGSGKSGCGLPPRAGDTPPTFFPSSHFSSRQHNMTRGNQRDNDRAKALKKAGNTKNKNTMTGTQYQKTKEDAAAIMREKQKKADEKRAAEAAGGKK
ncbi:unnamed protein product [Penicillium olsonii]|uniref:Small EDRK-rich factor-like N-terminal domain-containing protein n=1 Tax=Penicillium olsonii TaxID=99116 RepID=A0A9W4HKP0_PENOL|nr:unnamed protein product [Penicillium olsonii]CAG7928365.1 unnamed protein product [Penicillium olsonii]CAG8043030.1 unnamed protein product [Penicillium olsonii]CAG8044786.1 unnamed protein product [Penicillium olsonii]CAG8064641.1 unnamed protein product [Penicillium olsonii]